MTWLCWLDRLARLLAGPSPRRPAWHRLALEGLEDRTVPTTYNPISFAPDGGINSLRALLTQANNDPNADSDVINLNAGVYSLSLANGGSPENANVRGDLDILLGARTATNTLTIQGQGASTVIDATGLGDRVFHILGANTRVIFQNLVIQGGQAADDGTVAGTVARGGGILSNGILTLNNVTLTGNSAVGNDTVIVGLAAEGGAVYVNGPSLTLTNATFSDNRAAGGAGTFIFTGTGGAARGGAVFQNAGTLTSTNSVFTDNVATGGAATSVLTGTANGGAGRGGGYFLDGGGIATFTGGNFTGNSAVGGTPAATSPTGGEAEGGGVAVANGSRLTLAGVTLANNIAQGAAASAGAAGTANGGDGLGGAVSMSGSTVSLTAGAVVSGNRALGGNGLGTAGFAGVGIGGGVRGFQGEMILDATTLDGNLAAGGLANSSSGAALGGGVFAGQTLLTLTNSTLQNNKVEGPTVDGISSAGAGLGGGLYLELGTLTARADRFLNNQARGGDASNSAMGGTPGTAGGAQGGGVYFGSNNTVLQLDSIWADGNAALSGNSPTGAGQTFGGGIANTGGSPFTLSRSTVSNNTAATGGGGIYNPVAALTLSNTTVSGNQTNGDGGGILLQAGATLALRNSTVTNNTADADANLTGNGGGVFAQSSSVQVTSTIIAGNRDLSTIGLFVQPDITGNTATFSSGGHNFIGNNFGTAASVFTPVNANNDQVGTSGAPLNPDLNPLANNGGIAPTQLPRFTSPVVDAGSNPDGLATDERGTGFPRTQGLQTDVGAVEFPSPDLTITKTDGVIVVGPGGTVTYTLTVNNRSYVAATGVVVSDTLPQGATLTASSPLATLSGNVAQFPAFTLAGLASQTLTVTVRFGNQYLPAVTTLTNTATVADDNARGPDATPADNTATDTDALTLLPTNLTITKTDGVTSVVPGQTVTYTLTVTNHSNQLATGVLVRDTLPQGATLTGSTPTGTLAGNVVSFPTFTLAASATQTLTVTVRVGNQYLPAVTSLTNTATVQDDGAIGPDTVPADNTATDTDTLTLLPTDLTITKTDGVTTVVPGQTVTYTLTVTNHSNQLATGVIVRDTLPQGLTLTSSTPVGTLTGNVLQFPAFTLAAGAAQTLTITARVASKFPVGAATSLTNMATVADDGAIGPDTNPADNTATDTDTLTLLPPDLMLTVTDGVPSVVPGQTVTYTLTVTNRSNQLATGVVVQDGLPQGATLTSTSPTAILLHDPAGNAVLQFQTFDLPAGASQLLTLTVQFAPRYLPNVLNLTDVATVRDDGTSGPDANPVDNSVIDVDALILPATNTSDVPRVDIAAAVATPVTYANVETKVNLFGSNTGGAGGVQAGSRASVFVSHLYNDVLGRAPGQDEVNAWVAPLQLGLVSRADVANAIWASAEHRALQVMGFYQLFFHRAAAPGEVNAWVGAFQAGQDETLVALGLVSSAEYAALNPGDYFVAALYFDVLGRKADPGGFAAWTQALHQGTSRTTIALGFLQSQELYLGVIDRAYVQYLHRAPSPGEETLWLSMLQDGRIGITQFAEMILASDEFNALPP